MIKQIEIKKYKSIDKLEFPLGRVNVLIGENGAGKSNILESIALAGAASSEKLDNEFLASRGIRVTRPEYMRSAFPGFSHDESIKISVVGSDGCDVSFELDNDNQPYSKWQCATDTKIEERFSFDLLKGHIESFVADSKKKKNASKDDILKSLNDVVAQLYSVVSEIDATPSLKSKLVKHKNITFSLGDDNLFAKYLSDKAIASSDSISSLNNFIIYSPENSSLRNPHREGQIEPLGINGEGLLRLISVLHSEPKYSGIFSEIRRSLRVLGWFDDFDVVNESNQARSRIEIRDRYLESSQRYFDQMCTNEGFLFLLFYFSLFSCDLTPKFFAIDNVDASLNPKLCSALMEQLVKLSATHNKQVVLTTHNPAVLDGLNLDDDEQRLFVVSRNRQGYTRLKRILKPHNAEFPVRLSEAFLRGVLGGLPKGF